MLSAQCDTAGEFTDHWLLITDHFSSGLVVDCGPRWLKIEPLPASGAAKHEIGGGAPGGDRGDAVAVDLGVADDLVAGGSEDHGEIGRDRDPAARGRHGSGVIRGVFEGKTGLGLVAGEQDE